MSKFTTINKTIAAAVLGTALFSGAAIAQMSTLEEQAAQVEQAIALMPTFDGYEGPISAMATDEGRIELTGMVDNPQQMQEIEDALGSIEGLDMDLVDNNIIQQ